MSGNEGYVTLDSLAMHFDTPAWAPHLRNQNSKLSEFFMSSLKHESGKGVDYDYLVAMALLHCKDKSVPRTKANTFFSLL